MNTLILVTLTALVAMATASSYDDHHGRDYGYDGHNDGYGGRYDGYGGRHGYGFKRTPYGVEARYNNAARQQRVNHIAEKVGASSGTARYYGVPGTGRYFDNHGDGREYSY